jgi:LmbE family N-acetylglucosaminyl deacetylase
MYSKEHKNILAIGAHFDDIEIGCGGTLYKYAKNGANIYGLILTDSSWHSPEDMEVRSRSVAKEEGFNAAEVLGYRLVADPKFKTLHLAYNDDLIREILGVIEKYRIDTVYTHWIHDAHQDHAAASRATITACKHVPRVLMYRSNWYDSLMAFRGNFYSDISDEFEKKIFAIDCYKSEMQRTNDEWKVWVENECRINGLKVGCRYAEGFEVLKYTQ